LILLEQGVATFSPKWTIFLNDGGDIHTLKAAMVSDIPLASLNNLLAKI
jgi:hypothetical protein